MPGIKVERSVLDEAHDALVTTSQADEQGYVELQTIPYRAHHLLASIVLANTKQGDRVFEGGVSSGYFARAVTQAGRTVDGFELDPDAAQRAREVCETVWQGDLSTFDLSTLNGPYDLVLFGDTLEHVPDPEAILVAMRKQLKDDGTLVISVPNIANWTIRLSLLAGRFTYKDRGILDRTHLRFFTVSTLRRLLEDSGFDVDDIIAAVPVPFVKSSSLARVGHIVGNLRPNFFAYNMIAVAHPRPDSNR